MASWRLQVVAVQADHLLRRQRAVQVLGAASAESDLQPAVAGASRSVLADSGLAVEDLLAAALDLRPWVLRPARRRCRLCSTSKSRISSRCLFLQVVQVQVDVEALPGPVTSSSRS